MGSIPFALSIHHFISSVGSDAGFASIIGLAILILLYFAQARETSTLRNRTEEATERIGQLEARLSQVARGQTGAVQPQQAQPTAGPQVAVAPRPAVAAAAPVAGRVFAPAAPAGVAAPALAAATKLIPTPAPAPAPAAVALASGPQAPAPAGVGSEPSGPAPQGSLSAVAVAPPVADPAVVNGPAPATVAGAANGSGRIAPPRPASPGGGGGAQPGVARRQTGAGGPRVPRPPQGALLRDEPARSRVPRAALVALGALGVVLAVVVLLLVTSGGSSTSSSSSGASTNTLRAHRNARVTAVNPASVTVAVLNGTPTNGLAHRIAQQLTSAGYKPGTATNAADQTHTTTIVAYLPGFKRDAVAVARTLKLSSSAVQLVDANTQVVACGSGPCSANVIVTVGADLAGGQ